MLGCFCKISIVLAWVCELIGRLVWVLGDVFVVVVSFYLGGLGFSGFFSICFVLVLCVVCFRVLFRYLVFIFNVMDGFMGNFF